MSHLMIIKMFFLIGADLQKLYSTWFFTLRNCK